MRRAGKTMAATTVCMMLQRRPSELVIAQRRAAHGDITKTYTVLIWMWPRRPLVLRPGTKVAPVSIRSRIGANSHLEEYVSQGEQPTQRLRDEVCLPMRDPVKHGVAPAPARYGAGAVTFHWTVAALIVFLGGRGRPCHTN